MKLLPKSWRFSVLVTCYDAVMGVLYPYHYVDGMKFGKKP